MATPSTVFKLGGDAVFAYAPEAALDATMLLDAVDEAHAAFRTRLVGIEHSTSCSCDACAKLPRLDLKFVVHPAASSAGPARAARS